MRRHPRHKSRLPFSAPISVNLVRGALMHKQIKLAEIAGRSASSMLEISPPHIHLNKSVSLASLGWLLSFCLHCPAHACSVLYAHAVVGWRCTCARDVCVCVPGVGGWGRRRGGDCLVSVASILGVVLHRFDLVVIRSRVDLVPHMSLHLQLWT